MDASFTRLRAKGAFLVSSEQRAGTVTYVDLFSEKGGSLHVMSPWGAKPVHVSGSTKSANQTLQPDSSRQIVLDTVPGAHYHLVAR
jgi:hypothetical protein